jgi:hypothetical protein
MGWFGKLGLPRGIGSMGSEVSRALGDIAARHALVGDKRRVAGVVAGLELSIEREIVEVTGDSRQVAERLLVRVRLPKPLDVGLRVMTVAESDPRRPFSTGDAEFDRRFVCLADDAERGRALVSSALRAWLLDGPETEIADGGVTVAIGQTDAHRLDDALGYSLDITSELDSARQLTRAATSLRDVEQAWRALAPGLALRVDSTPLSAEGSCGRIRVEARACRDGFEQHHFELRAVFPVPLQVGLQLRPHSITHERGREADPLGDPAFDRVFVAAAKSTPAQGLFDAEIRERLLALRHAGLQLHGDDRKLRAWYGFLRDDPCAPLSLLEPLAELALALALRVEGSVSVR